MDGKHERRAVQWAFCYFFAIMCSYYLLRAVRDEMAVAYGHENLPWLFSATFCATFVAVPVYGRAASRLGRARLLPLTYWFFLSHIAAFALAFAHPSWREPAMAAFFVWLSVFNLVAVSVFWTFMADCFSVERGRRRFGVLAAGGSMGALAGPAAAAVLAPRIGPEGLLPVSAAFLLLAILAVRRLAERVAGGDAELPIGGGALDGVRFILRSPLLAGVALFVAGYTTLSTLLYLHQAAIVSEAFVDPGARTAYFASVDLVVNAAVIVLQLLATSRIIRWLGLAAALAGVPLAVALGLAALAVAPSLGLLVAVLAVHRAGNFTLLRPGKELLFTIVDRAGRYKAKNVLDTAVYRGGDAASAWLLTAAIPAGLGLAAAAGAAIAVGWALTGLAIGRMYDRRQHESESSPDAPRRTSAPGWGGPRGLVRSGRSGE